MVEAEASRSEPADKLAAAAAKRSEAAKSFDAARQTSTAPTQSSADTPDPNTFVEPEPTSTSVYELTTEDEMQLEALRRSWNKLSFSAQVDICADYDNDIDSAVDPMTASGDFDDYAVVAHLAIACA